MSSLRNLVFVLLAVSSIARALPRPTAIIFDCDGVLVESEALKYRAWVSALAPAHVDLPESEYRRMVGRDNHSILADIAKARNVKLGDDIIRAKEDAYRALQKAGVPPRAAGIALVKYLAARKDELHIKLALASGGMKSEILENLRQIGLEHSFDAIVSGTDDLKDYQDPTGTNKPKPYIYRETARRLGIDPNQAVVFEDSAAGVEAAARAGMTAYAVPNDYTRPQDFKFAREVLDLKGSAETTLKPILEGRVPASKATK